MRTCFLDRMQRSFVCCIRGDQPPLLSIAGGLRAIAVATAAYRSLEEGRAIVVDVPPEGDA